MVNQNCFNKKLIIRCLTIFICDLYIFDFWNRYCRDHVFYNLNQCLAEEIFKIGKVPTAYKL